MERTRSILFVPGNNPRMLEKAFTLGSDALDLDLEDAVPFAAKMQARRMVREAVERHSGAQAPRIVVRVNGPETGLTEGDLEAVIGPGVWAIHFTKIDGVDSLARFSGVIDRLEAARNLPGGQIKVICSLDSAHLVLNLPALLRATPRFYCVTAGGADFAQDIGTAITDDMLESLYARSYAVLVSRDAGVAAPLHPPHFNLNDEDGLLRLLRTGRVLGFQGGVALHPKQLKVIHDVFSPGASEVERAREVIDAFRVGESQGKGAILVRGRMIDRALVRQAEDVLRQAGEA